MARPQTEKELAVIMCSLISRLHTWFRELSRTPQDRRVAYYCGRTPLSDDEFMATLGCDDEDVSRVTIFIRRMFGIMCGVDSRLIHPSDRADDMWGMIDCGFLGAWGLGEEWNPYQFEWFFVRELCRGAQDRLDIHFAHELPAFGTPPFCWRSASAEEFGEWALKAAKVLLRHLPVGWQQELPEHPLRACQERESDTG